MTIAKLSLHSIHNYFEKKYPISVVTFFHRVFYISNAETNYWEKIYIKVNHINSINIEKWYTRFHQSYFDIMSIKHMAFFELRNS